MKHAVHSIIATACRTNVPRDRHTAQITVGKFFEVGAATAGSTNVYGTDKSQKDIKYFRSQVHVAPSFAKRKYEDMTSCTIEEVEAENDHELSGKISFFRENKRRRPPEPGNLLQVHDKKVQDQGDNDIQARKRGPSIPRKESTSRVAVTPEVCGESDLTAENHMAEESSRSSNNDGSSKFESAAESVSKGSIREPRSDSSVGVLHCFLDHTEGIKKVNISEVPSHQDTLVRNDDRISRREIGDMSDSPGGPQVEQVTRHPHGATEVPSSGTNTTPQVWSKSNEQWLQLGVGPSRKIVPSERSGSILECNPGTPPFQRGSSERPYAKRKNITLMDFAISDSREAEVALPENANVSAVQWQAPRGSVPQKFEPDLDSSISSNPASLASLPSSSFHRDMGVSSEVPLSYNLEKDLRLFGRDAVPGASAQLVLASLSGLMIPREPSGNAPEKDRVLSSRMPGSIETLNQSDPQGSMGPGGTEDLLQISVGKGGVFNRTAPALVSRSGEDVQLKSPQSAVDHTFQFQRDGRHSSLAILMQSSEDQRQAGHSWLPPSDAAPKLFPLASNFQGWTSDLTTGTKTVSGSIDHAGMERHSNHVDLQFQRASDDWGSLFRRVGPNVVFPSQCQTPDGPDSRILKTGLEKNAVTREGQDNTAGFTRAIKIQNTPQSPWITPDSSNLGSVASWCLNGKPLPGARGDKLEDFPGERPLMSHMLQERIPVHGRYPVDQMLNAQSSQRQSWQPASGHPKLQHGNLNLLRSSKSFVPTVSKPRFQVLAPVASQAGLWFILQSAESQNGEGGLQQITKSYLRIKDGKMPVSAVKKYLVSKLGLASEAEVEITCKGQPVVPNLPLQHVRDVIWFSNLNTAKDQTTSDERDGSSHQGVRLPTNCSPAMFSKDVLMVLTYRRHPRTLPPQHC